MVESDKKDIEVLLKNIQKGLKKHSVKELSDAILNHIGNSDNHKTSDVNKVFEIVGADFGIMPNTIKRARNNYKVTDARHIVYCLLHYDLKLSIRHIAKKVFDFYPNSVVQGLKRLKHAEPDKIKVDAEFVEAYNRSKEKLVKFINEQQQ